MADEKEAEGQEGKKSKLPLLIILIVVGVLVVGGGVVGFLVFTGKIGGDAEAEALAQADEVQQAMVAAKAEEVGSLYSLKTLIVNLAGNSGSRYLKIKIDLELDTAEVETEITKKLPMIIDTIISLLSSKTYGDIQDIYGKELLKEEIISRVNLHLSSGKASKAYITEFVIQ